MELVHGLFNRIEALAVPSCVGIDGIAVGGGLEISLAFDRLFVTASPKTKLGFPRSISASCQAMAALAAPIGRIGTKAVLDMMLTGRPVGSKDAIESGLADEMVDSADDLAVAMRAWMLSCNGAKPAHSQRETTADANAITAARDSYLKRARADHTPAPLRSLIMLLPLGMTRRHVGW